MHAISHSLAQRGALRNGARWHPYVSPRTSGGGSSHSLPHTDFPDFTASAFSSALHTPTSVPSISPSSVVPGEERTSNGNPQRAKYLVSLLDQAVRSLGEIWQPKFIPAVFTVPVGNSAQMNDLPIPHVRPNVPQRHSTQLPSPISPMTNPSPPQPRNLASIEHPANPTSLVPLKGFVHEVLRRSRTSATALQTALCYIEAVRTRIPELYEQELRGEGVNGEPDLTGRIVMGLEDEDGSPSILDPELDLHQSNECPAQDKIEQIQQSDASESIALAKKRKTPSAPLPPLPPFPTPLLCPRRTFLAAVILASKFTQDKCYSNRAWAKLSGLSAREIGRCERALGDALEWRLWVGKVTSANSQADSTTSTNGLARCKSESDIKFSARAPRPAASYMPSPPSSDAGSPEINRAPAPRFLGRAATVPSISFSQPYTRPSAEIGRFALPMPMDVSNGSFGLPGLSHQHQSGDCADYSHSTPEATPTLSPSSLGERTIQVNNALSSFTDDIATPINNFPTTSMDMGNQKVDLTFWPTTYSTAYTSFDHGGIISREQHIMHVQQ